MTSNPVGWFEIYVQDMARARKFYEAVLEVTLEKLADTGLDMWNFPMSRDGMGAAGALVRMEGVPSGGNSTIVYFHCTDCADEESRVVPAGGKIHKAKFAIGQYGFIALVVDCDGNMIGLHSMK